MPAATQTSDTAQIYRPTWMCRKRIHYRYLGVATDQHHIGSRNIFQDMVPSQAYSAQGQRQSRRFEISWLDSESIPEHRKSTNRLPRPKVGGRRRTCHQRKNLQKQQATGCI